MTSKNQLAVDPSKPQSLHTDTSTAKVTIRYKNTRRSISESDLQSDESLSTIVDLSTSSLPTESCIERLNESSEIVYKTEIENLKMQLNIANEEIDKLNLENTELKKTIHNFENKIKTYKSLITSNSPLKKSTPRIKKGPISIINKDRTSIMSPLIKPGSSMIVSPAKKECPPAVTPCSDCSKSLSGTNKYLDQVRKVIILSDEQGSGLRIQLQNLLGSQYSVISFIKSGASLKYIIASIKNEVLLLNKNDYVIVEGGCHENNPSDTEINLHTWLSSTTNTNIILSEVPSNNCLNENKLNYLLRFICKKYENELFMDMNYSRNRPYKKNFILNLSRSILREILHIDYKHKAKQYQYFLHQSKNKLYADKSVQTNLEHESTINNISNQVFNISNKVDNYADSTLNDTFFRQ